MAIEIRIPRLGWSMEEGTFVGWLKRPGEAVSVGEPLFELEGDKALQAVESIDAGTLYVPPDAPRPGSDVLVGTLLGYLLAPGETPPVVAPTQPAPRATTVVAPPVTPVVAVRPVVIPSVADRSDIPIATPRARRLARELGVDWTVLVGTGCDGRIRAADILAARGAVGSLDKLS